LKITFEAKNKTEAYNLLKANDMRFAIDNWYEEIIRPHLKYNKPLGALEINDEIQQALQEIAINLIAYFNENVFEESHE